MYQKKQPTKTDQEWNKIRFQNSLGPQIGGLIHDAVALTIAQTNVVGKKKKGEWTTSIQQWLDTLYDIAEAKKKELTEITPVSDKAAKKADEDFQKKYNKESKLEDLNNELNEAKEDDPSLAPDWHDDKPEDEKLEANNVIRFGV